MLSKLILCMHAQGRCGPILVVSFSALHSTGGRSARSNGNKKSTEVIDAVSRQFIFPSAASRVFGFRSYINVFVIVVVVGNSHSWKYNVIIKLLMPSFDFCFHNASSNSRMCWNESATMHRWEKLFTYSHSVQNFLISSSHRKISSFACEWPPFERPWLKTKYTYSDWPDNRSKSSAVVEVRWQRRRRHNKAKCKIAFKWWTVCSKPNANAATVGWLGFLRAP